MTWIFNGLPITAEAIPAKSIGFLYKITNINTGEWYVGRKLLTKAGTRVVKGKKKKVRLESDWKDYWSSNDLIKSMAKEDPNNFKREILLFVPTLGAMAYSEEYLLYKSGALFDPKCYNGNIRAKIMRNWFDKLPNLHNELEAVKI
jgi:hypothetical protein